MGRATIGRVEELMSGDGPTCRLVAAADADDWHRELERLAPGLVGKVSALLDLTRPELQHGPHGTVVVLFTVDERLDPVRWVVVGTPHEVLVIGDPAAADDLRETLQRIGPRDPQAAFRVALLGLAKSVPKVLAGAQDVSEEQVGGFRLSRGDQRKRLRKERARLFNLRELFATQSRELGELDEVDGHTHDLTHAVRRARNAFDQGSSSAARLYAMAGDVLSEESAIVNERLTLVSTLFLPATVTTGFFGMNFGWLTDHIGSMTAFVALGVLVPVLVSMATYALVRRLGA